MERKIKGSFRPHGGLAEPVHRILEPERARELQKEQNELPSFMLSNADMPTLRRIGDGGLSPLVGPMTGAEFGRVLSEENIERNGVQYAWTIPVSFPITDDEKKGLLNKKDALIRDPGGSPVGHIEIHDIFPFDKKNYLTSVYGTERFDHPGARMVLDDRRDSLIGGLLSVFPEAYDDNNRDGSGILSPRESREFFKKRGWDRIIAFQTRNPLHRAHEYAMVVAIERLTREGCFAGVVLNPLLGELKSDDVPAEVRMKTYRALHEGRVLGRGDKDDALWTRMGYDLNDQFALLGLEIKMFYAGPKEAVMHAIYRQNFGFTDLIIGRKHADAPFDDKTPIWGDFDAQEKFENLKGELLINNLNIGFAAFYGEIRKVGLVEDYEDKGWKPVTISGTEMRRLLTNGEIPSEQFMRPEVSQILIEYYRNN